MKYKVRIFLAAYVDFPNAQNINCDNIARYLDKEKFEVHVMYTDKMLIDKAYYREQGIYLHKLIHHRFVWYWSKLFTMLLARCDIYYLPKAEEPDKMLVKLLKNKRKLVSSIEGVVGAQIKADDRVAKGWFESMDAVFSISQDIQRSAKEHWDMNTPVMYLGIDAPSVIHIQKECVSNVIWIGSIIQRKHPEILLDVAAEFPKLSFIMIGDGDLQYEIRQRIANEGIDNVTMTGRLANKEVYEKLRDADILLMTSDMEGLPKVIGEAMSMSVPAIYINRYYDVDYVRSGENGFAVKDVGEMTDKLRELIDSPQEYRKMSAAAAKSIEPYLWKHLIKQYEEYFESLVKDNERD